MILAEQVNLGEHEGSIFQPDILAPIQYLETFRRKAHLQGEWRLMFAVLEDAIGCYQKYLFARREKETILFQNANDWIFSQENDWVFSFDTICEILGIDPSYLRRGLAEWRVRKLGRRKMESK